MPGAVRIVTGDITRLEVDAIVNAANSKLAGGGGVDGAIHRAAGPELKKACERIGGCPTGDARTTPGFDLPARWIVHAVGPVWRGGGEGEQAQLLGCYEASFREALEQGAASIAFPCISTGAYGYPAEEAAAVALSCMDAHRDRFESIVVCCFSDDDDRIYREQAARLEIQVS